MTNSQLFDAWPDVYEKWFQSPIGQVVQRLEAELILNLAAPRRGDFILDAGCGTGLFSQILINQGARIVGLDISRPMLTVAKHKFHRKAFMPLKADIQKLPLADNSFDKTLSITTIEFVQDGMRAVSELLRVTRPGGSVVVATLNRLSPWAARRRKEALQKPDSIFRHAIFRSPTELLALAPIAGKIRTAIFFNKDDYPPTARQIEAKGRAERLMTGAFVAAHWQKPA